MLRGSFESIHDLVSYVKNNVQEKKYIFRGQVKPWTLQSSLFRCREEEREKEWKRTLEFCKWMLNNPLLSSYHEPQEQLIAIAQHHGYKTDLVDFTWDIEVAAYFATHPSRSEDLDINGMGAIWAVEVSLLKSFSEVLNIPVVEHYEIHGLWRLENQKGLFVRDHGGSISQLIGNVDMIFNHSGGNFETDSIQEKKIYPVPNDFELEIQRYTYLENTKRNIEDLKKLNWMQHFQVINNNIIKENIIDTYDWDNLQWKEINKLPFLRIDSGEKLSTFIMPDLEEDRGELFQHQYIDLIKQFQSAREGQNPKPNINYKTIKGHMFDQKSLNEVIDTYIFTLLEYPYSTEIIAESLHYYWRYLCLRNKIESKTLKEDELSMAVYGGAMHRVGIGDSSGVATYAYIPIEIFEGNARLFEVKNILSDSRGKIIQSNFECLWYVTDIKKIFSLDEAIEIWAKYVNPYQCSYRPKYARIYSPYYVTSFGMP